MKFAYNYLLSLLILIPVAAFFCIIAYENRKKAMRVFAEGSMISRITTASFAKQKIKIALTLCALLFFVLAAARPQFGTKLVEVKEKGADVVLVVDVSASMLAQDANGGPSRLVTAKRILTDIIRNLGGNRIGIIAFAGTAFWQCPLTLDLSSANMFLDIMDENLIPMGGTAIGSAIRLADSGLEKTPPGSKSIVLITDGEDHNSDPEGAAEEAAKQGVKIFTIGIGNPNGEPIPLTDENGNFSGYKKNKKGDVVMSKMDEALLSKIASVTNGAYYRAGSGFLDTSELMDRLNGMEKRQLTAKSNREYEDRFQIPLFIGLLLLIAEMLIPETKKNREERIETRG
jgi:Ca-activated chloride channel family protein